MRPFAAATALLAIAVAAPVIAAAHVAIAVPAGSLSSAVLAVGAQANVSIGIADPTLGAIRVPAVRGRMSARRALTRLLAGAPATLVGSDDAGFRIVPRKPTAPRNPAKIARASTPGEIIVTGSKRATPLASYPGSVTVIGGTSLGPTDLARGSDALVDRTPILASTHLGSGRDKIFIRGIADSSFNGQTQSTVGEYLGDARLNYNAPDPDLALYDMAAVEVIEGPQGTLYGAGTLGGILRLVPAAPDPASFQASLAGGGSFLRHGAAGGDVSGVVNVPIVEGRLALRGVAYAIRDGGYIDDPSRGLTDVNATRTNGGRATLRYTPDGAWTIDLAGVIQNISARDGQYAERELPPLSRSSVIAQPFDNDYALASLTITHDIGGVTLVSASSIVSHQVGTTYDASPSPETPTRFVEDDTILLYGNETRLSHEAADGGGWVVGGQYLHSRSRLRRTLGPVGSEPSIAGTRNSVDEAALYGEATIRLLGRLFVTGGGRLAYDHLVGQVIDEASEQPEIRRRGISALPSVGLLWRASPRIAIYARYQEGYRPGGLSVQAGATQHFEADSVATWETGVRFGTPQDRISATMGGSYAKWEDIQADLVGTDGLPYTANIGSGRVFGLEAQAHWRPVAGATIDFAVFANDSALDRPAPAFESGREGNLPNIADVVARVGGRYGFALLGRPMTASASMRYVGRSRLGVGPVLDLEQGGYLDAAAGLTVAIGRVSLSLDATNLADARRNIFALGNPFGVARGDQVTPPRPRTVRLGAAIAF